MMTTTTWPTLLDSRCARRREKIKKGLDKRHRKSVLSAVEGIEFQYCYAQSSIFDPRYSLIGKDRPVSFLRIQNLLKTFNRVVAVNRLNLEVREGEVFTLLGSSGCGKTTTLRLVGGLEKPDGGEIHLGNRCLVSDNKRLFIKPEKRDMGMVFQSYALWPHMTVFENVVYPLKLRGIRGHEAEKKVADVLGLVGLAGLEDRP